MVIRIATEQERNGGVDVKIEYLCDHPEAISILSNWYDSEWAPYYGISGPGDATADLMSRCNRTTLPIGLVALDGERVLGTAAAGLDVSTGLAPSIIGLLVGQEHRGQGIAASLIAACEQAAASLGHRRIYISTGVLGKFLAHAGWQAMGGEIEFLDHSRGSVFAKDL